MTPLNIICSQLCSDTSYLGRFLTFYTYPLADAEMGHLNRPKLLLSLSSLICYSLIYPSVLYNLDYLLYIDTLEVGQSLSCSLDRKAWAVCQMEILLLPPHIELWSSGP